MEIQILITAQVDRKTWAPDPVQHDNNNNGLIGAVSYATRVTTGAEPEDIKIEVIDQ